MDLTLDRIKQLLAVLPPYNRPTIHVTGTNGKGSTTAIVSSILVASNITTGRFNSPHLVNEWDSISLNGAPITAAFYREVRERVERLDTQHGIGASNFEILTATAMMVFEEAHVDMVVMEVGMGGRLDATNALPDETILVSAITTVDLDHQAWLGHSIEEIAREKAGIARQGKTCVVARQSNPSVEAAIKEVVEALGAEIVPVAECKKRPWDEAVDGPVQLPFSYQPVFQPPPPQPIQISLPSFQTPLKAVLSLQGDHQLSNLSTALTIISTLIVHPSVQQHRSNVLNRIVQASIIAGVRQVKWPGRLHFMHLLCPALSPTIAPSAFRLNHNLNLNDHLQFDLTLIVDGAHNVASCAALQGYLTSLRITEKRTFLLTLSYQAEKKPTEVFGALLKPGDSVALLPFSRVDGMPWVTPCRPKELREAAQKLVGREGSVWCPVEGDEWWCTKSAGIEEERAAVGVLMAQALHWAAARTKLAILAGSLYLTSDLYRLIKDGGSVYT